MKLSLDKIVLAIALLAATLLADAWRSARHDSQQLAATLSAQNSVIQQARDREKQLPNVLPPLPLAVSIHDPNLSVPPAPGETPSTTISIPQPDLVPLYDELQDCRANIDQNVSLKKKTCPTKKTAPLRFSTSETLQSPSHTAEHSSRASREPQNGLP